MLYVEIECILCYNLLVLIFRGIVQLVERWSPKPNVVGSSPAAPARCNNSKKV